MIIPFSFPTGMSVSARNIAFSISLEIKLHHRFDHFRKILAIDKENSLVLAKQQNLAVEPIDFLFLQVNLFEGKDGFVKTRIQDKFILMASYFPHNIRRIKSMEKNDERCHKKGKNKIQVTST